jgi:hypothetical protein
MLLVYVGDVLAISHEPKVLIDAIGEYYKVNLEVIRNLISILEQMSRKCKCQMVGKFGLHLLAITSRMLSRLSKVYLWRMEKGMY